MIGKPYQCVKLQMIFPDTISKELYDILIQLCDSLAGAEGVLAIEERMEDVKRRYGGYPKAKWDQNIAIKEHFEEKTGKDISPKTFCVLRRLCILHFQQQTAGFS